MATNIGEIIEREPVSRFQIVVVIAVCLASVVDGFDIQAIAFAGPVLLQEWGMDKSQLGAVVAAALVGMAIGAPIGGSAGDRWGRRPAILISIVLFGLATLAAAMAADRAQLTILRFVSGIGFGAMLPNATTLLAEWMPSRLRGYAISIMIIGVPLGGMAGAALSTYLIPTYGWQSCFVAGGVLALLLAGTLWFILPESLRFLVRKGDRAPQISSLLAKAFGGRAPTGQNYVLDEAIVKADWRTIFNHDYLRTSLGLAMTFFCNLLIFYGLANWIPTILTSAGLPLTQALQGSLYFNLTGLAGAIAGAALVAALGTRTGLLIILAGSLVTIAVAGWLIGTGGTAVAIIVGLAVAGIFIGGLQCALYALSVSAYETHCRATGVGFIAGVGRIGAITSAFGGGLVLSAANGDQTFFAALIGFVLIAAVGVLLINRHTAPV